MIHWIKNNRKRGPLFIFLSFILFCLFPSVADSAVITDDIDSAGPQTGTSFADHWLKPTQRISFDGFFQLLNDDDHPDNVKGIVSFSEKRFLLPGIFLSLLFILILNINIFLPSRFPRSPPDYRYH